MQSQRVIVSFHQLLAGSSLFIECLFLDDRRITYSVQSLWWFNKNLPSCKGPPVNMDEIRETCPFVLREKVCEFPERSYNTENVMALSNININNNNTNFRAMNRIGGSGRIPMRKPFKSLSSSMSLDESSTTVAAVASWRDTNNNFRRSTSTVCLKDSRSMGLNMKPAPRET
jgi:hypothetical protein